MGTSRSVSLSSNVFCHERVTHRLPGSLTQSPVDLNRNGVGRKSRWGISRHDLGWLFYYKYVTFFCVSQGVSWSRMFRVRFSVWTVWYGGHESKMVLTWHNSSWNLAWIPRIKIKLLSTIEVGYLSRCPTFGSWTHNVTDHVLPDETRIVFRRAAGRLSQVLHGRTREVIYSCTSSRTCVAHNSVVSEIQTPINIGERREVRTVAVFKNTHKTTQIQ